MRNSIASLALVTALVLGGAACTSMDDDVVPEIGEATFMFDRTDPTSFAEFDVEILLHGGDDDHTVELAAAELIEYAEDPLVIELDAALADFDGFVPAGQVREAALVNITTTADELAPMCSSRAFKLHFGVRMDEELGATMYDLSDPVDVVCR